jgi:hypothetical protein
MYWIPVYILILLILYIFINDILELCKDLFVEFIDIFFYSSPTIRDTIIRIQPLWLKFKKNQNSLGVYEEYVLQRELSKYVKAGGDMEYFTVGAGSPI